jgi:hypothetical protein
MERGGASARVSGALESLWREIAAFNPESQREETVQKIALNSILDLGDQRRLRLLASERRLPPLLWSIIVAGGVMVIVFSPLLGARVPRSLALRVAIAGLMGLTIFSVYALERPVSGPARIDASDIRRVQWLLMPEAHPARSFAGAADNPRAAPGPRP